MQKALVLAGLVLASTMSFAQVNSTRETSYDWACCENAACSTFSTHQRLDSAYTACLNRSMTDGLTRYVQGGRYRLNISRPAVPANPHIPAPSPSGSALLTWIAPTTRSDGSALTNLAGYRVRYGLSIDSYTYTVNVLTPTTTVTINDLGAGTWYFVVASYDAAGVESVNSAPVSKVIP